MSEFVKNMLKVSGINDLYNTTNEEDIDRKRNIDQFVASVVSYEQNNEGDGIIDYLQSVTLQNDLQDEDSDGNSVNVSTVHASKGLEFDYVFIVGAEEGSFPLSRALESDDELEEERRLMYVAVTRARKKLYITRAKSRFLYGKRNYTIESRFLKEMELSKPEVKQFKSYESETYGFGNFQGYNSGFGGGTSFKEKFKPATFDNYMTHIKTETKENDNEEIGTEVKVGALVLHPKFGTGNVIKMEKMGENTFVTIDFKTVGVKTLSLSFAPLKVLGS
jgi:DNA helicase-2/ATP-dependent DNA helicase PcrA